MNIIVPVMESATVLAAHYAKACGRDVIMAEDISMGLMYAARHVTGNHSGPIFPEVWEGSSSDEDCEVVDDVDIEWTEYTGSDDMATKMNDCAATWDAWQPSNPAEHALKNAVDKSSVFSRRV